MRLDAHTMEQRAPGVLERAAWVAYLTDAGTPGISDPGADLVRLALAAGFVIEVLPGATAFVPALVASGLPTARFTFEGFLPRSGATRRARLRAIAASDATSIIYEAPSRLVASLKALADACGEARPASVSREISKLHEETRRGTLAALHEHYDAHGVRGEIVIVVGPATERGTGDAVAIGGLAAGKRTRGKRGRGHCTGARGAAAGRRWRRTASTRSRGCAESRPSARPARGPPRRRPGCPGPGRPRRDRALPVPPRSRGPTARDEAEPRSRPTAGECGPAARRTRTRRTTRWAWG